MELSRRFLVFVLVMVALVASNRPAAAAERPGQKWALLIGVDDYSECQDLEFCGNDQQALAKQLVDSGFARDQVFLLSDKAEEKKYLPFRENITRQIELILQLCEPGDLLIVSFSGHGVHLDGKSYFCPTEARLDDPGRTMIALDEVYEQLQRCPASMKLLLVDACRNDPRPGGQKSLKPTKSTTAFAGSLERPPEGILLLASCAPGQISMEEKELKHGVFMHFILSGLQGKAANADGVVTLPGLYDYASLETKKYVARRWNEAQTPYLKGEIAGSFEIARVDRSQPPARSIDVLPNGRLVFRDDFANLPQAVPLFGETVMTLRNLGGEGVLAGRSPGFLPAMYRDFQLADGIVEFNLRVPPPVAAGGHGIVFRSEGTDTGLTQYYAMLIHPATPQVVFYCWRRTEWALHAAHPFKQETWSTAKSNRVRVEMAGDKFRVYINGELVAEQTDDKLGGPGLIGLCSAPDAAVFEAAHFSDLRIYETARP